MAYVLPVDEIFGSVHVCTAFTGYEIVDSGLKQGISLQERGRAAFLPFAAVALKSLKRKEIDFEPHSLGEHLRKRRLTLGLTQAAAGQRLGVNQFSVMNWELEVRQPRRKSWPATIAFLAYDPRPTATWGTPSTL
jgi:hypothetical protein